MTLPFTEWLVPSKFLDSVPLSPAAITNYHRLGSLDSRDVFSHSSGGRKSKVKVSVAFPVATF